MKMPYPPVALFAAACLLANHGLANASDATLGVTAQIQPSACDIGFAGETGASLGKISMGDLQVGQATVLPDVELDLQIRCAAPTRVALTVENGVQHNGAAGTVPAALGVHWTEMMLIKEADHVVAGYTLRLPIGGQFADGNTTAPLTREGEGGWKPLGFMDTISNSPMLERSYSWGGSGFAQAYQAIDARVVMRAAVIDRELLPAGDEIEFDDRVAFSLTYL